MEQQLQKLTQVILERGELIKQLQIQCEAIQASVEEMKPVRPEVKTETKPAAPVAADSTPISAVTIDSTKLTIVMPYACSTLCSNHDVDVLTPASPVTEAVSSSPLSEGTSSLAPMVAAPPAASSSFLIGDAALDVAMSTAIGCTTTALTRCLTPCPTHDADASSSPLPLLMQGVERSPWPPPSQLESGGRRAELKSYDLWECMRYMQQVDNKEELLRIVVVCNVDWACFKAGRTLNAVNLPEFNLFKRRTPESVTALPKLRVLWAPKAGLEENVPSNWGRCHSLRMVNLAQNLPSGVIPRGLGQCSNLRFLNLSSNRLSGSCGNDLYLHCMAVFDVSGNELTGSIPAFANKGCSSQLMLDDIQSDYSSLVMSEAVAELSLGYCDSEECSVVYHNFAKNNFGGHLTSLPFSADTFGNKTLYAFLVDHNNFTGSLDAILLEQCGNLNGLIVSFRDNKIFGGLTAEISTKSRAIRVLDLAGNQISGVMPANIGLLVALVNMDISKNLLEGQIPPSFKDSKSFNIPSSLVILKDLTALLLNNNKLSGNISNFNQLLAIPGVSYT